MAGEQHKRRTPARQCLACGHLRVRGTVIRQAFLCQSCERRLLATRVEDPRYDWWVERLRRLWTEVPLAPGNNWR